MDRKSTGLPSKRIPFFEYNSDFKRFERLSRRGVFIKPVSESRCWLSDLAREVFGMEGSGHLFSLEQILERLPEGDSARFSAALETVVQKKGEVSVEVKLTFDNGGTRHSRYAKLHFELNTEDKDNAYIAGTVHDITSRKKKTDELVRARERAENSDRIKTAFLTNLSYEIRNPMNTIMGFTEIINMPETSEEKKKEYSNLIVRKGREMLSLVDDVIELAKYEAGQIAATRSEVNVAKLFHETQDYFNKEKKRLDKENILIVVQTPGNEKAPVIISDPSRLQQVFSILLENALQHTDKGYVQFGYEWKDNKNITFYVRDTGSGIHKDDQKNIFTRYKSVEFTPRKTPGSGLGLSLAKCVVDVLGGKIWLESEPGNGAVFYFSIPCLKAEKTTLPEDKIPNGKLTNINWKNKVILVVDDDEVNFQFIEAVLSETQAQVIHASNGLQALELMGSINKIDTVLMDLKMPEMNGYDACVAMKKIKKVPVIAQTAFAFTEVREKTIQLGFDGFIAKPIDIKQLLSVINKHMPE